MIENFENTLKDDMIVASYDAAPAAPAAVADVIAEPNVAAVPEPATWAMMLGGFAMAGASLRRRASKAVALPAR